MTQNNIPFFPKEKNSNNNKSIKQTNNINIYLFGIYLDKYNLNQPK